MNVQEEIRKLAYDFYEKSGRIGGMELEHWLRAEQVVMAKVAAQGKIRAAGSKPEGAHKAAAVAGGIRKTVETRPVPEEEGEPAQQPRKSQKTAAATGGSTKPKAPRKKKPGAKSAEKTRKSKS